jgi:creatinine amidohydrolase
MDKRTGIYLQTMTMRDIEERLKTNDVLIVPLGATEAHGPNAPIGEDIFLVTRMAEAVAERTGCTVSEPLWFGSHPYHHLGMPSTVPIPEDVFTGFVRAMIAGFWNMGFRKQILLNGHGQEYVIPTAIHQFGKRYRVPALIINVNWYHDDFDAWMGTFDNPYDFYQNFTQADMSRTRREIGFEAQYSTRDGILDYVRRHLRFGWWSLLVFASFGLILETLHGFKVPAYLHISNELKEDAVQRLQI